MLSRDAILAACDLAPITLAVPEWGGSVCVRGMNGTERDQLETRIAAKQMGNLRAAVAATCVCDESGAALFTVADVDALAKKNSAALDRIFWTAWKLSGMTKDEAEAAEKN